MSLSVSASRDPERAKRTAVARQYRREGYRVAVPDRGDPVPSFLDGTTPDLVAERDDDRVAVMVKRADRIAGSNELVTLAERIEGRLGWRFELISVAPPVEVELVEDGALDVIGQLVAQGSLRAAFLLRFAEMENILAFIAVAAGERLAPDVVGMAGDLVRSGALSGEALIAVRAAVGLRNAIVHGVATSPDRDAVERLEALVAQLRQEIGERRAA